MRKSARIDTVLAITLAFLVLGGLLIFLSASFGLLTKEGKYLSALLSQLVLGFGGGLLLLVLMLHTPLRLLRMYSPLIFGGALLLTIAVFIPGVGLSANGATRWIDLGITTFQPSEMLKIGYVVIFAAWLAGGKGRAASLTEGILPYVLLTGVVGVLLLLQPDTDTFLTIAAAGGAMLFAAGMRFSHLAVLGGAAVLLIAGLLVTQPYLMDRVQTFLSPDADPLGAGYQVRQSLIAIGSGGLGGRGFGQSIQKFNYLPEASSDAIFAVFAEEFGFIGAALLVLGFLFFALRGFWVAARAKDQFSGLVIVGIVALIITQSFINIGSMLGLVPVGGIPLVFVSQGGTALMIALGMAGILLAASKTVN